VQGTERDTRLPAGSVDIILALDVYHHLNYPRAILSSLASALKPEGRLVIVEYHKSKEAMPNNRALEHIRLGEDDAIQEIEASGWKLLSKHEHVPKVQWMAVFSKRP
jgi:SAM-dependent methyltransferase